MRWLSLVVIVAACRGGATSLPDAHSGTESHPLGMNDVTSHAITPRALFDRLVVAPGDVLDPFEAFAQLGLPRPRHRRPQRVRHLAARRSRSLRAFGWIFDQPAISQRVASDTAQVLDDLDARFPPAPRAGRFLHRVGGWTSPHGCSSA